MSEKIKSNESHEDDSAPTMIIAGRPGSGHSVSLLNLIEAARNFQTECEDEVSIRDFLIHDSVKDTGENTLTEDVVNHPSHYTSSPARCSRCDAGIECIDVVEHMNFCLGNAMKYIWRSGLKSDSPVEDLRKAVWYLNREINRIEREGDVKEGDAS